MDKRWLLTIPLVVVLAAAGAWFEPTRTVRGWARGEPFFAGRSANYWATKLESSDPKEQMRAPLALEEGKGAAVPVLIQLLGSPRETVRATAAGILTRIGPPAVDAVPALQARLDDDDANVRAVSAKALAAIKPTDPDVIKSLAGKLRGADRDFVIRPLSAAGAAARAAVPDLTAIARDASLPPLTRWEAIRTLGKIGPDSKPAVPVLVAALTDADAFVREHAAESLGEIGAAEAIPDLTRILADPSPRVRRDAVRSLGQFGAAAKSALPEVEKLVNDPNDDVRDAAKKSLRQIDPERK